MNNKTYFSPFMSESNLNLPRGPSIVFELDNLLGSAFVSSNYSKKKKTWVHLSTTYGLRAITKKPKKALRASWNDLDHEVLLTKRSVLSSSFKLSLVLLLYHPWFRSYWGKTLKWPFYALRRQVNDLSHKKFYHH